MLRQLSRGNASLMHNFLDIIAPTSELPTFVQVSHDSVSHFSKTLNRVRRRALELKLLLFLARLKIDAAREFTQLPLCSLMLSFSDRELNVNKHLQTRRNFSQKQTHKSLSRRKLESLLPNFLSRLFYRRRHFQSQPVAVVKSKYWFNKTDSNRNLR